MNIERERVLWIAIRQATLALSLAIEGYLSTVKPVEQSRERKLWLSVRQAALIVLGAIEDCFGLERTVIPKHKREN